MTVRSRFVRSGVMMLVIPVALIIVLGLAFITWFFVYDPENTRYLQGSIRAVWMLLDDATFQRGMLLWAIISVIIALVSSIITIAYLSSSLLRQLTELKSAANNIKDGNLDFEIMTSKYSELNEFCAAFESMRQRLLETEALRHEYEQERNLIIANMSHDLRTPITSIKGYVEGILDNVADTPEKKDQYLRTIYQKAETLEALVGSMTEFSAYEMKRVRYEFEVVDIVSLLGKFIDEYRLDLESEGISLSCELPPGPVNILADWPKMRRALSNVVENAVKYKKTGKSALNISLIKDQKGVFLTVADDGRGISPEDMGMVFEGHFRADRSRNSNIPGHGLGLSIVKQIVQAHRGRVWLKSQEGQGTTVFIFLPARGRDLAAGE